MNNNIKEVFTLILETRYKLGKSTYRKVLFPNYNFHYPSMWSPKEQAPCLSYIGRSTRQLNIRVCWTEKVDINKFKNNISINVYTYFRRYHCFVSIVTSIPLQNAQQMNCHWNMHEL